jgi:hypothetical protein
MARRSAPKRHDWRPHFLDALRDTGIVTDACRIAGVARSTAYEERQRNEDFALAWHDIEQETTERMEREAVRRAAEGVERAVYHQGEVVGHERHFSDVLLMFMLKARRPEVYRETTRHEHTGPNGGPITFADLAAHAAESG